MRSINLMAALLLSCLGVQAAVSLAQWQRAQADLETARINLSSQWLSEEAHRRFADAVESWRAATEKGHSSACSADDESGR
jgi:hypothetical protein